MITEKEMKTLIASQQGELDGAAMYRALAKAVKDSKDKETFLQLAKEEGGHAAVFYKLTGRKLTPNRRKGTALVIAYKILGKRCLYPMIAQGEYAAEKTYAPVVEKYPEVKSVQADEKRHGDIVLELLEERKEHWMKKLIKALLLISLGCWIGIHRNVIKAWITGTEMPEAPESHFWIKNK